MESEYVSNKKSHFLNNQIQNVNFKKKIKAQPTSILLPSYCFIATTHICFVLIVWLVPFLIIVSVPVGGSNFTVVPVAVEAKKIIKLWTPPFTCNTVLSNITSPWYCNINYHNWPTYLQSSLQKVRQTVWKSVFQKKENLKCRIRKAASLQNQKEILTAQTEKMRKLQQADCFLQNQIAQNEKAFNNQK